jgi:hypothetical protein
MQAPFRCIHCSRPLQRGEQIEHVEGDATEPFAITCAQHIEHPYPRTGREVYADELPEEE